MKIRNSQPKQTSGGYNRVFDNEELGVLMTKIQSTVISNGSELERIILEQCDVIDDVDDFIKKVEENEINSGVFVAPKKQLKKSEKTVPGIEPDIVIFIVENHRVCKIIELKEGYMFDTKKIKGEKKNLETFVEKFGSRIPFTTNYFICCFNEENKLKIQEGLKNEFDLNHILTGREFCEILNIDYDAIINTRKSDCEDNLHFFITELLNIPDIKSIIQHEIVTS